MKRTIICLILLLSLLIGCGKPQKQNTPNKPDISYKNSATSGVWLSFSEINTMLKSENGFKTEFGKVIENCKSLKISEIYIHIRSYCDSLFRSEYFPLISSAENIDYDIFKYITEECHSVGIKVHAWINPYRVLTASSDTEKLNRQSPAYKWLNDENADNDINVLRYNGIYLNPAEAEVRKLVIDGIREVLENYRVDGIHFDDYFYPTTDAAFDSASYEKYKANAKNPLSLDDWRRSNVNTLISGCYTAVKNYDPRILFTISPAAAIDKNYNEMYADVENWVENSYIDCVIPQLYFGFKYPAEEYRFEKLLRDWIKLASVNKKVKLIIGLAPYKIGTDSVSDSEEWCNDSDILAKQASAVYENENTYGYVFFSYTSLFLGEELNIRQRENLTDFINNCS